jgi:hypothetical protein
MLDLTGPGLAMPCKFDWFMKLTILLKEQHISLQHNGSFPDSAYQASCPDFPDSCLSSDFYLNHLIAISFSISKFQIQCPDQVHRKKLFHLKPINA